MKNTATTLEQVSGAVIGVKPSFYSHCLTPFTESTKLILNEANREGKPKMPLITVKAIEGRTIEQKRGLVKDITEAVVKNYGVKPEAVTIDIVEYSKENFADTGKLYADR